jgi:hypothetical protein
LPRSPFGLRTNTFDLHARQTNIGLVFAGPKVGGLTSGATFLAFILKDDVVSDSYGFLPFLAFGELRNEKWLLEAGLNLDVFNPVNPTMIPVSYLYGSGNTGMYRGQARIERYFDPSKGRRFTVQFAIGDPVGSVVTDNKRVLEDNGWPNVELRLGLGAGEKKELTGGRKLRVVGVSGIVGQLRTTGAITTPSQTESPRAVVNVNGVGVDAQFVFTKALGLIGEAYYGHGLGEYAGGVQQSFNPTTFEVIPSRGGFAELYYYANNKLHVHGGYGVDDPDNDALTLLSIPQNLTGYLAAYWDLSRIVQLGFEADYRKTDYFAPLRTADGMIFMPQILWRF